MHNFRQSDNKELNASKGQICLNRLHIKVQESAKEMIQTSHLNEFVSPLTLLLILNVPASLHLLDNLEGIEKLINGL
jgi:hypothetical protein